MYNEANSILSKKKSKTSYNECRYTKFLLLDQKILASSLGMMAVFVTKTLSTFLKHFKLNISGQP